MASKYARKVLNDTPKELRNFVMHYGNIVVRIHNILEEKGMTQKDLAG